MPRRVRVVKSSKSRALARQVDEEETLSDRENNSCECAKRALPERRSSLGLLKFLSLLRADGCRSGSDAVDPLSADVSSQSKYCAVFDDKGLLRALDSSEEDCDFEFFFRGDQNMSGRLFSSGGDLTLIEEGNEWDESTREGEETEKEMQDVSSPATRTTAASDASSPQAQGSPCVVVIADEPIESADSSPLNTGESSPSNDGDVRIGIRPISLQFPPAFPFGFGPIFAGSMDGAAGGTSIHGSQTAKPDPPASRIPFTRGDQEESNLQSVHISFPKRCDSAQTVVSELTCDSLSDVVAALPESKRFQLLRESLENRASAIYESEVRQSQKLDAELDFLRSQAGSKLQKLVLKFERISQQKEAYPIECPLEN